MKVLHVGGFNPLNRFKTLEDALKKLNMMIKSFYINTLTKVLLLINQ